MPTSGTFVTRTAVAIFAASPALVSALAERRIRVWYAGVEVTAVEVAPRVSTALKPYLLHLRVAHEYKVPPRAVSGSEMLDVEERSE